MANSPGGNYRTPAQALKAMTPVRLLSLIVLAILLALAIAFYWTTGDAVSQLSFLRHNASKSGAETSLVDLGIWRSAEGLAALAVTEEESQLAHEAEHLADHATDQAFAGALRQAILNEQHRTPSPDEIALKQKVANLQQLIKRDQAQVDLLSAKKGDAKDADNQDLDVAKAQLGLDSDELDDAKHDLDRASGDESARVQDELNAHEEEMQKYDAEVSKGQMAAISSARYHTLAQQISEWFSQRNRNNLIDQAHSQVLDDVKNLSTQHNALEQKLKPAASSAPAADQSAHLATLQNNSVLNEIMSIDDDRMQTEQQLAAVYDKWSAQVLLQHRAMSHLILRSLLIIVVILIAMVACDALVRRLMARLVHDRRQMRTLRSLIEFAVQLLGVALILLVIFGAPQQTPTILGLTTAALTIALQDYIIAFLGWFRLIGKNGIRIGDWVEINGVGGEVVEFKLMTTTLLETGGLADQGHPTGRHITFMNSYAIRGQFFNFSTAGQWMWDEMSVSVPASVDIHALAQQIQKAAEEETRENVSMAEREWRLAVREENLARFSPAPVVNLRPSGSGIELQLRFVTAAEERFELRNRLYQRVLELLHDAGAPKTPLQPQ